MVGVAVGNNTTLHKMMYSTILPTQNTYRSIICRLGSCLDLIKYLWIYNDNENNNNNDNDNNAVQRTSFSMFSSMKISENINKKNQSRNQ